jgi:hypothetical protein
MGGDVSGTCHHGSNQDNQKGGHKQENDPDDPCQRYDRLE